MPLPTSRLSAALALSALGTLSLFAVPPKEEAPPSSASHGSPSSSVGQDEALEKAYRADLLDPQCPLPVGVAEARHLAYLHGVCVDVCEVAEDQDMDADPAIVMLKTTATLTGDNADRFAGECLLYRDGNFVLIEPVLDGQTPQYSFADGCVEDLYREVDGPKFQAGDSLTWALLYLANEDCGEASLPIHQSMHRNLLVAAMDATRIRQDLEKVILAYARHARLGAAAGAFTECGPRVRALLGQWVGSSYAQGLAGSAAARSSSGFSAAGSTGQLQDEADLEVARFRSLADLPAPALDTRMPWGASSYQPVPPQPQTPFMANGSEAMVVDATPEQGRP